MFITSCQIQEAGNDDAVSFLAKQGDTRTDNQQAENHNCLNQSNHCVARLTWGSVDVRVSDGTSLTLNDAIIWWDGAEEWDWKIGNVHHQPGITIEALKQLLRHADITDVIFTRGMEGVLTVPQATIDEAVRAGKRVHVAFTRDAVSLFNKLVKENVKVGGFFHTTC